MSKRWDTVARRSNCRVVAYNRACRVGVASSQYAFSMNEKASLCDAYCRMQLFIQMEKRMGIEYSN